jgi:hypothetical protein
MKAAGYDYDSSGEFPLPESTGMAFRLTLSGGESRAAGSRGEWVSVCGPPLVG